MNIQEKLDAIVAKNNSLLCVGLDADTSKLPETFQGKPDGQFEFNKMIIDATHDLVCAYKPNAAFYEADGPAGIDNLKLTFEYIQMTYPDIVTILDAKRGDIGNTNDGYINFAFEYLGADSITLHPYMGRESLQPFLDRKDKGAILLCRTSNPGAGELQDLKIEGKELYKVVAEKVTKEWNSNENCMLVVGATVPEELAQVRTLTGDSMTFLVPGVGAQGGDVEKTVKAGKNTKGAGIIINSARGIIFAANPREEAQKLRDQINSFR